MQEGKKGKEGVKEGSRKRCREGCQGNEYKRKEGRMGGKGQEGKGGRRSKDLAETESFSIDVDSAVVTVCNASFTLSDSPERKKTKEGGEEGGRDEQTGQL